MSLQQVGTSLTQFLVGAITAVISLTVVLALTGYLVIRLFNIDPIPYQIGLARLVSGGRVVSFDESIPSRLADNLTVQRIERVDTDGDGFREWLVFYKFDKFEEAEAVPRRAPSRAPTLGVIYDSDRGNPPVIFPYVLRTPDRDYLSEGAVDFEQVEITNLFKDNVPELLIWGNSGGLKTELTIFRLGVPNSEPWDFPRDERPLYEVIGFFRGSGGVEFDAETKQVTVVDRGGFERSQLAVKTTYELNPVTGSYLSVPPGQSLTAARLSAPSSAFIDFAVDPPQDIFNTPFPEKVVLAFYQALWNPALGWNPADFLARDGRAAIEFRNKFLPYFGFPSNGVEIKEVHVTQLNYFTAQERIGARDTVLGEEPQQIVVEVSFEARLDNNTGFVRSNPEVLSYLVIVEEGQWRISHRVDGEGAAVAPSSEANCDLLRVVAVGPGKGDVIVDRTATFFGNQSSSPSGIRDFRWDFGDGQTANGSIVNHQYGSPGSYNVTLTVTDNANCVRSTTITAFIP